MLERILQTCPTFQFTSCQTWPDTDHTLKSCKTYYTIRYQSWFGAANARTHFPDYTQLNTASSVKTGLILNTRIIIYIYIRTGCQSIALVAKQPAICLFSSHAQLSTPPDSKRSSRDGDRNRGHANRLPTNQYVH